MAKDVKEVSTTKKVYLTPGEFLWDNYKRGKRMEEDYLINEKLREHELAGKMIGALYKLKEEGKLDARNKKTLLKNINNLAKSIRNINRILKEVL